MGEKYDLLILQGPLMHGYLYMLQERLGSLDTYKHVLATEIYQDHPEYGVRDVANIILSMLREKNRVFVCDFSLGGGLRDCLRHLILQKISSCQALSVQLVPKYGPDQIFWAREFSLACEEHCVESFSDNVLHEWFDQIKNSFVSHNEDNSLGSTENITFGQDSIQANLMAVSQFKFEVPALLLQWESVYDMTHDLLTEGLVEIFQEWSTATKCGRIIIVCDGQSLHKGHRSVAEEKAALVSCINQISSELDCPVYVLQIVSTKEAGEFCMPPNPGILAFLQRRHCLDLSHQSTLYIYSDAKHMKMAERAGVRHVKISTAVRNHKMSLFYSAVTCKIPDMLKNMQMASGKADNSQGLISLGNRLEEFHNGHICFDHPRGHREFVFAKTLATLQRFQELYCKFATPLAENCSRLTDFCQTNSKELTQTFSDSCAVPQVECAKGACIPDQKIPKWMTHRSSHVRPETTFRESASTSSTEGTGRAHQTLYVMTEKELLDTALEILKQSGRKDIFQRLPGEVPVMLTKKSLQQSTNCSEYSGSGSQKRQGPLPAVQTESPQNEDKIVDKPRVFDFPEAPTVSRKKSRLEKAESSSTENPAPDRDYLNMGISSATPAKTELVRKNTTADLSMLDEIFF